MLAFKSVSPFVLTNLTVKFLASFLPGKLACSSVPPELAAWQVGPPPLVLADSAASWSALECVFVVVFFKS